MTLTGSCLRLCTTRCSIGLSLLCSCVCYAWRNLPESRCLTAHPNMAERPMPPLRLRHVHDF